ncbi:MAG: alpha/beta fold hydrolase [Clostridia bacterium]|nr:alpha/beta fold hydrolase [Clostridia bacterium]
MNKEYLFKDPHFACGELPIDEELILSGRRGKLFCVLFRAGGRGKKPAVLLLHGLPGNEQNLDLAQSLRRTGINVLTLHYSGSWGSEGAFSFKNCIEDAVTALDFLRDCGNAEKYLIDTDRLFVIGHSMGGFLALYLAAECSLIRGVIAIAPYDFGFIQKMIITKAPALQSALEGAMASNAEWLMTDGASLSRELKENRDDFDLAGKSEALSRTRVLIITGKRDETAAAERHGGRLYAAVNAHGRGLASYREIDTGHGFTDRRIELINAAADEMERWLG